MPTNIPISFFSLGLLLALYFLDHLATETIQSFSLLWTLFFFSKIVCWIPIAATLWVWIWDDGFQKHKLKNDPRFQLYDQIGQSLKSDSKSHLPFLPDQDHCTEEEYNFKQIDIEIQRVARGSTWNEDPHYVCQTASWALVTGASRGIGRAICVSLARRKVPMVLVARNPTKLEALAEELESNYGIRAIPLACDLANPESVEQLIETLQSHKVPNPKVTESLLDKIDILINNAGLGLSSRFLTPGHDENNTCATTTEAMIRLNVLGTTKLTQLIGNHMLQNKANRTSGGRIVVVSSVYGAIPGGVGTAVYAATKAYQRSLCVSLAQELSESNAIAASNRKIGVVCVLPGAVKDTDFCATSQMTDALIFNLLPGFSFCLTPEHVAEATVKACIDGTQREVFVGWAYILTGKIVSKLLPDAVTTLLVGLAMKPRQLLEFQSSPGRRLSKILLKNKDQDKDKNN